MFSSGIILCGISVHDMNIPLWVISGTACGIIIAFPPKANREMSRASRAAHASVVHKTRLLGKYDLLCSIQMDLCVREEVYIL